MLKKLLVALVRVRLSRWASMRRPPKAEPKTETEGGSEEGRRRRQVHKRRSPSKAKSDKTKSAKTKAGSAPTEAKRKPSNSPHQIESPAQVPGFFLR